jgi:succinoglycan biosynthesis protein ExoU
MSNQPALVDVIIAVWNGSATVETAVRSALSEPEVNRVIVVDDRSTDGTPRVMRSLADQLGDRIRFERMESNSGPAAARNRGLALSEAEWVSILDADDYFQPGRIRILLDASDGADFVADDHIQVMQENDVQPSAARNFLLGIESPVTLDLETFVAGNISQKGRLRKEFGFLKPIMRRSFMERHQLRYEEALRLGEDFALYARAIAAGAIFRVLPSKTYVSVIRPGSISGNHTKRDLESFRESNRKLQQIPSLTDRERELIRRHYEAIDAKIQWLNVIEAVKARNVRALLSPFFIRWTTSVYLTVCLAEQLFVRSKKLVGLS